MKNLLFNAIVLSGLAVVFTACGPSTRLNVSRDQIFQEEIGRAPDNATLRNAIRHTFELQGYDFSPTGSDFLQTDWQEWENVSTGIRSERILLRERFTIRFSTRGDSLAIARIEHQCQRLMADGSWRNIEIPESLKNNYRSMKEIVHSRLLPYMLQMGYAFDIS